MENPILLIIISFIASLVLGYPIMLLVSLLGIMDMPGSAPHKKHARPTPLAGGILVLVVFSGLALFCNSLLTRDLLIVLAGALIIFIFGLWDDMKGLPANIKLIGQLFAASFLIGSGVQVYFMSVLFEGTGLISPSLAQFINIIITFFWLVGITNAFNMIDSMDGIVAGLCVIASIVFMWAAGQSGQADLALWSACLVGVSMGLYFWNAIAIRFFLGDSGAQTLGFLLASFGILYNPLNQSPESSWIVPILLLGVPIFDTTLVVFSRLRKRQPIGSGRRDHTYHRFIRLGLSPRIAVLSVHVLALIISSLAFITFYLQPSIALIFFVGAILGGLAFLFWLERQPSLDDISE